MNYTTGIEIIRLIALFLDKLYYDFDKEKT